MKQRIGILLALVLVLAVAGCGKKDGQPEPSPTPTDGVEQLAPGQQDEQRLEEDKQEGLDMTGAEFTDKVNEFNDPNITPERKKELQKELGDFLNQIEKQAQ